MGKLEMELFQHRHLRRQSTDVLGTIHNSIALELMLQLIFFNVPAMVPHCQHEIPTTSSVKTEVICRISSFTGFLRWDVQSLSKQSCFLG